MPLFVAFTAALTDVTFTFNDQSTVISAHPLFLRCGSCSAWPKVGCCSGQFSILNSSRRIVLYSMYCTSKIKERMKTIESLQNKHLSPPEYKASRYNVGRVGRTSYFMAEFLVGYSCLKLFCRLRPSTGVKNKCSYAVFLSPPPTRAEVLRLWLTGSHGSWIFFRGGAKT